MSRKFCQESSECPVKINSGVSVFIIFLTRQSFKLNMENI